MRHFASSAVMTAIIPAMLAAAGAVLTAHHSFAPFDITKERMITGKVTKFEWTNPHSWIWIEVPNEKGGVDTWGVEGMSPNYLARRGWTKSTLKPGDKVSIVIRPMKDGSKAGMFVSAKLADGSVLMQVGDTKDP